MKCWLRTDPQDGNDSIEATVDLRIVPRKGDLIELWDKGGGFLGSGESLWPEVETVILCGYDSSAMPEVWLTFDGFDLDQVKRAMAGAGKDRP